MNFNDLPVYLREASIQFRLEKARNKLQANMWKPQHGRQTEAYLSEADELFYGGAAGGGKTDLLLGLAGTQHRRSIIFRRIFPSMRSMIERSREIYNTQGNSHTRDSYNESLHIWRLLSGRMIEFSSIQYEHNKEDFRGRPHDLYGWDEITEFTQTQYEFVNAWNRTTYPGQRCRIVATGNPPTTPDGEWVMRYWGAWLDPQHSNPAKPGELRWYAKIDGKSVEVENGKPFRHNGEDIQPRSRTFIRALLEDNPILESTGYRAKLQDLPEPLRSQMLYGDFTATSKDDIWQVIPTDWIVQAQNRWLKGARPDVKLRAVGVDPSRGGDDETTIAKLYGAWFDELVVHPGAEVPNGQTAANHVLKAMGNTNAPIYVDVIGIGSSVYDHLAALDRIDVTPVNVGSGSNARDKTGRFQFSNLRSQIIWKFREALDPSSGQDIALPPDPQLRNDLRAPRYTIANGKIKVEAKDDIKKRIGRSPDRGEAVLLCWHGVDGVAYIEFGDAPDVLKNFFGA